MENAPNKDVEVAKREAQKLYQTSTEFKIRKDADLLVAADQLKTIKTAAKNVKAQKDAIIKPAQLAIANTRDLFKPIETYLADAEKALKTGISKYHDRVEKAAAKKAAEIEQKIDAGELGIDEGVAKAGAIKQAPTSVKTETGGVQFRVTKKVRITSVAALPASYLSRPRVLEALRMEVSEDVLKNKQPCPAGAEIYEVKTVAGV